MVEKGNRIDEGMVFDKKLEKEFKSVWEQYVPKDNPFAPNAKTPFTYLNSEPFWNLTSFVTATIDEALVKLIKETESRDALSCTEIG